MSENPVGQTQADDMRFFRTCISVMAALLVSGFVSNIALGRSNFSAPPVVHVHALLFMGWVVITVTQAWLAAAGARNWHIRLGRISLVWVIGLMVLGPLVTIAAIRTERVPFFFQPQHLLLADPATLLGFLVLFAAALTLRKRPDWHSRLQVGAFVMLMGPGVGRLLPLPLLMPYAFEIAAALPLVFILVCALRDMKVHGRPHLAWIWPVVLMAILLLGARTLALSPAGDAIYRASTQGSLAQGKDGRAFPNPPPRPPAARPPSAQ